LRKALANSCRREKAKFYRIARRSASEASAATDILHAMHVLKTDFVTSSQTRLEEIAAMLTTMAKNQEVRATGQPRRGRHRPLKRQP